jgi:hypothetical protein
MVVTKMGTVTGVRNAAIVTSAATVAGNGLGLLSSGLLRLCALWLRFLCTLRLCLLGALRLRLLCVLRRCFLGTLRRLCFLCVLRLLLVLRCLRFSSALFFLLFLCECRKS